jgi:hypothetical protein
MNQEREERTIRELFRQLRRDDEPSAPPFAASLEDALSRNERTDRFRFVRPAAVAIVVLLLLGGVWLSFPKRSAKTQFPIDVGNSGTPAPNVESPPAPEPTSPSVADQPMKSNRHRQKHVQPRPATLLVSQWRSPTVSLLRTPGEQFLKTVPRLDESLIEIRPLASSRQTDQRN